jgi:hypothetical protein
MAEGNTSCGANLNDARAERMGQGEDRPEVQVVGEHDARLLAGPLDDLTILGAQVPDAGPVRGIDTSALEVFDPMRGQADVDEDPHEVRRGTSTSSARHAAYERAAWMSSSSR